MDKSTGKFDKLVEKPKIFAGNNINAVSFLLNPSVLDRIELRPTSIEKEVFPKIAVRRSCMLWSSQDSGWTLDSRKTILVV